MTSAGRVAALERLLAVRGFTVAGSALTRTLELPTVRLKEITIGRSEATGPVAAHFVAAARFVYVK